MKPPSLFLVGAFVVGMAGCGTIPKRHLKCYSGGVLIYDGMATFDTRNLVGPGAQFTTEAGTVITCSEFELSR